MEEVNVVLDEKMKKKLRSFAPIDVEAEFDHTPEVFKALPRDHWPVFKMVEPSGDVLATLEDKAGFITKEDNKIHMELRSGTHRYLMVKACLRGWENYRDPKGNLIKYEGPDSARRLPIPLQIDLEDALKARITITEEEKLSLE